MARFELSIREPGKEPRVVPLSDSMVVGRSRRADVTIDDQEVGREQFRIGVDRGTVVIEGIGKTNRTIIDTTVLEPGERLPLSPGSTIRVGKTTFLLLTAEATQVAGRPSPPEATMVSPGPIGPRASAPGSPATDEPLPQEDQTGGQAGPVQTMKMPRPGAARGPGPSAAMPASPAQGNPAPASPAQKSPAQTPPPEQPSNQTMQWQGGFRPGAGGPARPEPKPPATPAPPAPAKPRAATPPPSPPPARPPTPPPAAPAMPPSGKGQPRPTTVALAPDLLQAELGPDAARVLELEARLHEAMPRLFVKSDPIRRRIRLLKTRCTLGRAENADALLPVESVSEAHAEIAFDGTTFTLRDCGSTNGTWVDGAQLRRTQQALTRHSLIGLGTVRAVFLCNDRGNAASDRRLEVRALRRLIAAGRVSREEGQQVLQIARGDASQSIAEILLEGTPLAVTDWVTAIATARTEVTLMDRLRQFLARLRPTARAGAASRTRPSV